MSNSARILGLAFSFFFSSLICSSISLEVSAKSLNR